MDNSRRYARYGGKIAKCPPVADLCALLVNFHKITWRRPCKIWEQCHLAKAASLSYNVVKLLKGDGLMYRMFSRSGSACATAMPCADSDMLTLGAAVAAPIFALLGLVRIIMVRLCLLVRPDAVPESAIPAV